MMENKITSFTDEYVFLSNSYPSSMTFQGRTFQCAESAYLASMCANEEDANRIAEMGARAAREYISKVEIRSDWNIVKDFVLYEVICEKFQNKNLASKLLDTGTAYLKPVMKDTALGVDENGNGDNKLGVLLMTVRLTLPSSYKGKPISIRQYNKSNRVALLILSPVLKGNEMSNVDVLCLTPNKVETNVEPYCGPISSKKCYFPTEAILRELRRAGIAEISGMTYKTEEEKISGQVMLTFNPKEVGKYGNYQTHFSAEQNTQAQTRYELFKQANCSIDTLERQFHITMRYKLRAELVHDKFAYAATHQNANFFSPYFFHNYGTDPNFKEKLNKDSLEAISNGKTVGNIYYFDNVTYQSDCDSVEKLVESSKNNILFVSQTADGLYQLSIPKANLVADGIIKSVEKCLDKMEKSLDLHVSAYETGSMMLSIGSKTITSPMAKGENFDIRYAALIDMSAVSSREYRLLTDSKIIVPVQGFEDAQGKCAIAFINPYRLKHTAPEEAQAYETVIGISEEQLTTYRNRAKKFDVLYTKTRNLLRDISSLGCVTDENGKKNFDYLMLSFADDRLASDAANISYTFRHVTGEKSCIDYMFQTDSNMVLYDPESDKTINGIEVCYSETVNGNAVNIGKKFVDADLLIENGASALPTLPDIRNAFILSAEIEHKKPVPNMEER